MIGFLFASFALVVGATPVSAVPEENTSNNTSQNESQEQDYSIYNEETQELLRQRDAETENTGNSGGGSGASGSSGSNSSSGTGANSGSSRISGGASNSDGEETSDSGDTDDGEELGCFDVVEGMGWLACPITSVISTGVDALYGIINNFLAIEPITFNQDSAIYMVWAYARDVANIAFILAILVVIFSQVTGVGFDNYNVKKTLPRIVLAAILVNVSFVICSLAVDVSNIAGASLTDFMNGIVNQLKANSAAEVGELSWSAIIGRILGTAGEAAAGVAILGTGIALTGGLSHFVWVVIPLVFGALISLAIGVFTISLRQAVVALLVMVSPLAFVAYLLPNTEQYFKKWKDMLMQMLVFFPLFALLYGASNLAGWTFIINGANSGSVLQILVGMAIQVFPIILSFKLMQMSNTVLGKVSETLNRLSQPLRAGVQNFSATQAATAKARYDAGAMSRSYTVLGRLNPANLRSFAARRQYEMEENRKLAESRRQKIMEQYRLASEMNKSIEFDKNGRATLSDSTRTGGMSGAMRLKMEDKEASLNLSRMQLAQENALGQPGSYMKNEGINDAELRQIIARQRDNWLDYKTETNAKRRNDLADEQFYANEVLKASKMDPDSEYYKRMIVRGGGVNALSDSPTLSNSALTSVIANAYDITEAERAADINRLTTFFATQATESVEADLQRAMAHNDVNSITAALNTLDVRGDGDKVAKYVREFMDSGQLKVGTEFANNLAKSMLGYGENPLIKGVGKYVNVETLAYTEGRRQDATVTFKEFITGKADFDDPNLDEDGNAKLYEPKYDVISTIRGKDFTKGNANRTTMKAIMEAMMAYGDGDDMQQRILDLDEQIRPQLVTAIPTYNSGSEEIIAAAKYLTGMVPDGKGGWKFDGTVEDPNGEKVQLGKEFFYERTKKYLGAMTPGDLVKFKSDILSATKGLFKINNGDDAEAAKAAFQDIFGNEKMTATGEKVGNGAMATLLAGDLSNLGAMKKGLREMLDLEPETLGATLEKYGIEPKKR